MTSDIFNQLIKLIEQGETVICCESPFQERYRILRYISQCCASIKTPCLLWNLGQSAIKKIDYSDSGQINIINFDEYIPPLVKDSKDYFIILKFWENYQGEGVLIIENLYPWISANVPQETQFFLLSEWVKSNLLNLSLTKCADSGIKCAILLGPQADLHPELAAQIPLLTQDLPDTSEILIALNEEAEGLLPPTFNERDKITIARGGIGLYICDFLKGLKSISFHHDDSPEEIAKNLLLYKINLLNRLYEIEFIPPPKVALGGLELMQEAFKKFKRLFSPLAKAYKLKVPKGIMLVGPPGTGKSHSAKVCSQILGVPLILVDWGNFRSYGNEAERRLKKLLKLADRLNEVVIYFDDFDKGFSGDDDVARRLAGQLLTWMQERTSDVIVIASVNRGAEKRIKLTSHVIRSDGSQGLPFPSSDVRRIHRVAVALGGDDKVPIQFGDFGKGFVHVFDRVSFETILRELDTITDFVQYLIDKEDLYHSGKQTVFEGYEEDLLGYYQKR
jgi:hypothetical protein